MTEPNTTFDNEHERLKAVEANYHMALKVISVLASYLTENSTSDVVAIADDVLLSGPDLTAWRDEDKQMTYIRINREA